MVITGGDQSGGHSNSLPNQASQCNRLNSVGFSCEMMGEKSSNDKTNLQQGYDNVLKSDSEMEQDIEMELGTAGCAQEQETENEAAVVDKLRLCSPCQKTGKEERKSRSRTVSIKKSKISRLSSESSSGSSRSGSISSSDSSRSSSACSSGSSRSSSACSSGSSRSSSTSSSGLSRSISSSGSSRSRSVSSAGRSRSGSVSSERYGSSSDEISLASRGRYASLKRSYRRSRQTYSRSRSRSWSRSCYQQSRHRMSNSTHRYRSRSRCYIPSSRSYQRSRSSLRYRRSRSRSLSRSPSRPRRSYYGFARRTPPPSRRTPPPSHRRNRSRSRDRSIHLTQTEKKKLLEIAKANADKLLGMGNMHLPPRLMPLKNERRFEMKANSDAVKELTKKEYKEVEEDEPIKKISSATARMDTSHWIAFSVKNTVAKPLNQTTANTSAKESPEHKRKGSPYGQ
ncbi:arginine/serine-rich protein 1 isoform X2 [Mustelus asterias]